MRRADNARMLMLIGLLTLGPIEALAQKRQRDVIGRDEIAAAAHPDMYQVIRSIRPHFLEPPKGLRTMPQEFRDRSGTRSAGGSSGIAPLVVYVDGRRDTGVDALKLIAPQAVEEVRYLDPARSENQFGIMANGGAIVVKLRSAPARTDTTAPNVPRRL